MIDRVMDVIRTEIEACDCPQGFQICRSLAGGTGSGLASMLIPLLKEDYPGNAMITSVAIVTWLDRMLLDVVVFPDYRDNPLAGYNAMLAMPCLVEHANLVPCFDNYSLYRQCFDHMELSGPTHQDIKYTKPNTTSND